MQKSSIVLLAITLIAAFGLFNLPSNNNLYKQEFETFKTQFARRYSPEEESFRFAVFTANLEKVNKHNSDPTQTYQMEINQFSDMTTEEFTQKILINNLMNMEFVHPTPIKIELEAPQSWDWRSKNAVTPIKNQGSCGSCWSFSTTGTLESAVFIAGKSDSLLSFSEQQLVDCCGKKGYQCLGCSGAWPEWAMNYINSAGIVLESQYKYKGVQGTCQGTPTAKKYLNSQKPWTMLDGVDSIKSSIASTGPVSICVDASNWSAYRSGVFSNCGGTNLNHAVSVVGYDKDGNWLVRNSWGTSWGNQGYITLKAGNTCGIANHALVANLA